MIIRANQKMNVILQEDFEAIYGQLEDSLRVLRNKSFLVSGANGMIASYLVSFLLYLNDRHKFNISITGLVRSLPKKLCPIQYEVGNVCDHQFQKNDYTHIIHAASLASPIHYAKRPVDTALPNVLGTINLLSLGQGCPLDCFLFVSSSEVYGDFGVDKEAIKESEFGQIDPLQLRAAYAESKRMGENLCCAWYHQHGVPTKIVRPFHTYGPGLTRHDGRVYAEFIYSVIDRKNIILNSTGEARRAFCYLSDALSGILVVLAKGECGEAYNLGNPGQDMSILDAAKIAAAAFPERNIQVEVNASASAGRDMRSKVLRNSPDISKLQHLGWCPSMSLQAGIIRTVQFINGEQA